MEEKLVELMKATTEFTERSKNYYIDINYDSKDKELEINIRNKVTYDYIEVRKLYLDKDLDSNSLDRLIKDLANY